MVDTKVVPSWKALLTAVKIANPKDSHEECTEQASRLWSEVKISKRKKDSDKYKMIMARLEADKLTWKDRYKSKKLAKRKAFFQTPNPKRIKPVFFAKCLIKIDI